MQELSSSTMKTMSSREIAKLTNKEHYHVKRDIKTVLESLELDASKFGGTYRDAQNREQTEYLLDQDLTMTVVMGYSAKLRHAVAKRWRELEQQVSQPKELSRLELIQIAMESEQERLKLEAKVQEDAPKVKFAEAVATIASLKTVGEAAKVLGIGPNKLHAWMRENGWTNRDRTPSQSRVTQGHLTYRHGSYESFGVTVPTISTRITPKGFELLFRRLRESGMINQD